MSNEKIKLTALVQSDFTRDEFEKWVDDTGATKVTDEQWERVTDYLNNQISQSLDELIYEAVVDFRDGEFNE